MPSRCLHVPPHPPVSKHPSISVGNFSYILSILGLGHFVAHSALNRLKSSFSGDEEVEIAHYKYKDKIKMDHQLQWDMESRQGALFSWDFPRYVP